MSSGWGQSPLRINFSVSGRGQSPLRIRLPEVSQFLQGTWLRVLTGFRWGHSPLQINFRAGTVPAVDAVRPFDRDSSRRCFGISGRGQSPPRIHFQDGDSPGCESRLRIPVANQSRLESISGWGQSRRSVPAVDAARPCSGEAARRCFGISGRGQSRLLGSCLAFAGFLGSLGFAFGLISVWFSKRWGFLGAVHAFARDEVWARPSTAVRGGASRLLKRQS